MPKQRSKKNTANSEPYILRKKHGSTTGSSQTSDSADNQQDVSFQCDVCTNSSDHLIQCDRCMIWHCCTCGKVSERLITVLDEFKELHWFCHKCDAIAIDAIQAFNPTESTPRPDILSAVTGVITTAIQSLQEALKTTINDLVSAKTTHDVPQNTQSVPVHGDSRSLSRDVPEDLAFKMVDEYKDRERRKLNLIFRNVPESQVKEPASRVADDIKLVSEITKEIGVDHVEVVNAVRLGQRKNDSSVSRLLRVQVSNLNVKRDILSNAKKLRNVKREPFKGIYINPDLSIKERNAQKELRDELKRRKDAGEAHLKIVRGRIVNSDQSG